MIGPGMDEVSVQEIT